MLCDARQWDFEARLRTSSTTSALAAAFVVEQIAIVARARVVFHIRSARTTCLLEKESRAMADEPKLKPATSLPDNFTIHPISPRLPSLHPGHAQPALIPHADVPPLGPLLAFKGNWHGRGFNTIFRPN